MVAAQVFQRREDSLLVERSNRSVPCSHWCQHPVDIQMTVFEMHLILAVTQLAFTHPAVRTPLHDHLRAIGGRLQEEIGRFTDANFRTYLEAGWHREYDPHED